MKTEKKLIETFINHLSMIQVRFIMDTLDLDKSRSKIDMAKTISINCDDITTIFEIIGRSETNKILIENFEISPRKSFIDIKKELELYFDNVFDELDHDIRLSEIVSNDNYLKKLAKLLPLSSDKLSIILENEYGNKKLKSFIHDYRNCNLIIDKYREDDYENYDEDVVYSTSFNDKSSSISNLDVNWLKDELKDSTNIRIASCFYDIDFIENIISDVDANQTVRLIFNQETGPRKIIQDNKISKLNGHANIRTIRPKSGGLFHTKLFIYQKNNIQYCLVGSANFTHAGFTKNEEVLVKIENSDGLIEYFEILWENSKSSNLTNNINDYFKNAYLLYKPNQSFNISFNPFKDLYEELDDKEKEIINKIKPPFADQANAIGSFNIEHVINKYNNHSDNIKRDEIIKIKNFTIETSLGLWISTSIFDQSKNRITTTPSHKMEKYARMKASLNNKECLLFIENSYTEYCDYIVNILDQYPTIKRKLIDFEIKEIKYFCEKIKGQLNNDSFIARVTKPYIQTYVPDFIDDHLISMDFLNSFFSYLNYYKPALKKPAAVSEQLSYFNDFEWQVSQEDSSEDAQYQLFQKNMENLNNFFEIKSHQDL